jgi:hypothetical protein
MLPQHIYFINKPRVSNEYPAISTHTGSLMHGVDVSSEDCDLKRITSQGQSREFREFMTPYVAQAKTEWHQKWDQFIHLEHDCGPLCSNA